MNGATKKRRNRGGNHLSHNHNQNQVKNQETPFSFSQPSSSQKNGG